MGRKIQKRKKSALASNVEGDSAYSRKKQKTKKSNQKQDECGEYISKDAYGTIVSVETESDRFKAAERIGKMRAANSNIVCASDYQMKKKWSAGWNTGFLETIGIRKSSGPPAPRRSLATSSSSTGIHTSK